jgi:hypothetical protein
VLKATISFVTSHIGFSAPCQENGWLGQVWFSFPASANALGKRKSSKVVAAPFIPKLTTCEDLLQANTSKPAPGKNRRGFFAFAQRGGVRSQRH